MGAAAPQRGHGYVGRGEAWGHQGLLDAECPGDRHESAQRQHRDGEVQTVKYQELIPMLPNELRRQRQALQQESAEVAMLRKELADLRALVEQGRETAASSR